MLPIRNLKRNIYKALQQPGYAWEVFIKRFKISLSYKLFKGKSFSPEAITLFLTHHCNLRCKMCGQWGDAGITKTYLPNKVRDEVTFEELKNIVNQLSSFKPHITLFGGEPLLHRYCLDLIKYIKKNKMHCCLITNAFLLEQKGEEITNNRLDELNISIDGPQKVHDEIRGIPGLFKRIASGIKKINQLKELKKTKLPLINLEFVITSYNYQYLEEMVKIASSWKVNSLNFHQLIFIDQKIFDKHNKIFSKLFGVSSKNWEGFILKEPKNIEINYLIEKIREIKSKKYNFLVNFYPNFPLKEIKEYYLNPNFIPKSYTPRCLSPWMVCYIFPNGDVRPCLNFDYTPGNIQDKSFKKIWNNSSYVRFRKILKKMKIFPVCIRCTELYRY